MLGEGYKALLIPIFFPHSLPAQSKSAPASSSSGLHLPGEPLVDVSLVLHWYEPPGVLVSQPACLPLPARALQG